jgi:hypothetical protein
MRKIWNSLLALAVLGVGAAAQPIAAHAQDTTPPEITFLIPPPGVVFTRMETIPVTFIVTDVESGVDPTSVVLQAGDHTIPIPAEEISLVGVVTLWLNARPLDLGPLTLTATAIDGSGNVGTSTREIEIGCSFESASAMVAEASTNGYFSHPGVDRHLYLLIQHADALFETDPLASRATLQWALDSVTRYSRVLGRTEIRANFMAGGVAEAAAQELEEELRCLLEQLPVPGDV